MTSELLDVDRWGIVSNIGIGLNLAIAAIVYWNTIYMDAGAQQL